MDETQATNAALMKAMAEYFSNKLFAGMPLENYQGEVGYVNQLVRLIANKMGASGAMEKFFAGGLGKVVEYGMDKVGEGLEEVVTAILDPIIDRITWDPNADMATIDEVLDEFTVGTLMSIMMGIGTGDFVEVLKPGSGLDNISESDRAALLAAAEAVVNGSDVSNSVAEAILASPTVAEYITASADVELTEDMTQSQRRAAIKDAVGVLATQEGNDATEDANAPQAGLQAAQTANTDRTAAMMQHDAAAVERFASTMGTVGQQALVGFYDEYTPAANYIDGMMAYYNAGLTGAAMDSVDAARAAALNSYQAEAAYTAGQADAQNGVASAAQTAYNDNTTHTEVQNNVESESGSQEQQRAYGVSAEQRDRGVQGRAESADARRAAQERSAAEVRAAVDAQGVQQVSTASLGITNGTERAAVKVVPAAVYTGEMKAISQYHASEGREVTFFTGQLEITEDGETFTARGATSEDGKHIWVCADDAEASVAEIALHEEYHAKVATDPSLRERVRQEILATHDEAELEAMVDAYISEYGFTGVDNDYILDEIFADAYAGIDIFDYTSTYEGATRFTGEARSAVLNTKEANDGKVEQSRGGENRSTGDKGNSEVHERKRDAPAYSRGGGKNIQKSRGETFAYSERGEYERNGLSNIIAPAFLNDATWNEVFHGFTTSEITAFVCNGYDSGNKLLAHIVQTSPEIKAAVNRAVAYINRSAVRVNAAAGTATEAPTINDHGGKLTAAQQKYFANTAMRDSDGRLLVLYHGSGHGQFDTFDVKDGVWLTTDRSYAERMAGENAGGNEHLYELYANIVRPLDIGEINGKLTDAKMQELARLVDMPVEMLETIAKPGGDTLVCDLTRTSEFLDMVAAVDYDGLAATEGGVPTYCAICNANQVKQTDNKNPSTKSGMRYSRSSNRDAEYDAAVEAGDEAAAQEMVDEAAEAAGYRVRGYHGTTNNFTVFDRTYGNPEGDWGKGFYFTTSEDDVNENYANNNGADLTIKIELLAERMEWMDGYEDMDEDERREAARKQLSEGDPHVIHAALRIENPCVFGDGNGLKETYFDFTEEYDEETDEYGEPTGLLVDFVEALNDELAENYERESIDVYELLNDGYDGYSATELEKRVRELLTYVEDDDGNLAGNEVFRAALERMGFDAVADNTVTSKFGVRSGRANGGMVGVDDDTTHFIVFSPEQIKQTDPITYDNDGNVIPLSQRFDDSNPDIRYSRVSENAEERRAQDQRNRDLARRKAAQAEYWRSQTKLTTRENVTVRESDVNKEVRRLLTENRTDASFKEVKALYTDACNYLVRGEPGSGEIISSVFHEKCVDVARAIAVEDAKSDEFSELNSYLRNTPITLSQQDKADITDYNDFRRRNFGKLRLVNEGGTPVDVAYQQWSQKYPGLFPESITHPADQLLQFLEVRDELDRSAAYSYDMEEAVQYLTEAVIDSVMSENVRQSAPTFADRQAAKLAQAKAKAAQAIAREREKNGVRTLRANIIKHCKNLSTELLRPSDKKHIPENLRGAVATMLASINQESSFERVYDENGKSHRVAPGKVEGAVPTKRTEAFRKLRDQFGKVAAESWDMVIDPDLFGDAENGSTGLLDKVVDMGDVPLTSMTAAQLRTVWNAVRAVEHAVRSAGKVLSQAKYESTEAWAHQLEEDTKTQKPRRSLTNNGMLIDIETPYTFFSHYGKSGLAIYRMLRDAQDRQTTLTVQIAEEVQGIISKKDAKEWTKKSHTFTTERGDTLVLTTDQVLDIYNLWGREQGKSHLLGCGIMPPKVNRSKDAETGKAVKKQGRGTASVMLTENDIGNILSVLTDEQRSKAKKIQALCTGVLADLGNEASMRAYGYKKFTENDYWPIRSAREGIHSNVEKGAGQERSIRNIGLAKSIVPNANNPVDITGLTANFADHVSDMLDYAVWLCPMEDAERLYNFRFRDADGNWTSRTIKGVLDTYGGNGAQTYWGNLMADVQNGIKAKNDSTLGALAAKETGNVKGAAVGANLRVIIQQPTAWLRAMLVLNPIDMAAGLAHGVTKGGGWKKAKQYAPIAMQKAIGGFDIMSPVTMMDLLYGNKSFLDKFNDKAGIGAEAMDNLTWGRLWNACEHAVKRTQKSIEVGSPEFYEACKELFTETIDQTQVVDGVLQRSQVMRSSNAITQQAASFMGEPIMSANMVLRAYEAVRYERDSAKRSKAIKGLSRATVAYVTNAVVNAMAQSLIDGIRDDDKKKKYWERVLGAFFGVTGDESTLGEIVKNVVLKGNLVDGFNPMSAIPYVSDLLSLMKGFTAERLDMSAVADLITSGQQLTKALNDDGRRTWMYATEQVLSNGAKVLGGVSVGNIVRDVWGIFRSVAIETDNYETMYDMEKAIYRMNANGNKSRFYDILYMAKNNNEAAYKTIREDMLKNGYTEDKIENAMKERVKKEDSYKAQSEQMRTDWTSRIESYDAYKQLDEESQEKVRKSIDTLANSMALDDTSGGEYVSDDKWEYWATGGSDYGVDETEAILFKVAYDMAEGEKNSKGNTISGSKQKAVRELLKQMMPWLTDQETEYLMALKYKPTDEKLLEFKESDWGK